jgi:uncharacterized membrane protein YdjX (TVP38/TMEM64 family)
MKDPTTLPPRYGPAAALRRYAPLIKWASVAVIVVSAFLMLRQLPIRQALDALEGWIKSLGVWGPVVFGLIYVAAVVLLFPASLLTLAGGGFFDLVTATVVVSLSATTGAALAFLIARYLAREQVVRKLKQYPRFEALDRAVSEGGWKIVALLRLSPAVPFNLQNYLYGVTGIRFWPCVLTSWLFMLPGTFMYVYLGTLGRESLEAAAGSRSRGPAEWALLIVGLLATVAVTVYITCLARRALRQRAPIAPPGEPEGPRPEPSAPAGLPWGTLTVAAVALVALALAVFVQFRPDLVHDLFGIGD